ncbi:hypothetical protein EG329_003149 [Mollisiaceae sp. DMI_Dod_QoI]|nr:hypothetical protein EG329_003149 [Helotiales sp. DMI_Dod_QoI]
MATDMYGYTAYIYAIKNDQTEISQILKLHEVRVNGSLGLLDPLAKTAGVSVADESLPPQGTQRLPRENQDMIQQLRDEMSEIKQLLAKPEVAPKTNQPNTIETQTSTVMTTETEQQQEPKTEGTTSKDISRIMTEQTYVIVAVVGGLVALLISVVILLNRVNKAMTDIEQYVLRGR